MEIFRVHAYAVEPHRTIEEEPSPEGGAVEVNASLRTALEGARRQTPLTKWTKVDLHVDTSTRTNEVRDRLLEFSFGSSSSASAAARRLGTRLGESMDRRSKETLFVLAAAREDERREITVWTFPRDEAFQFRGGRDRVRIRLLEDVFSRSSKLRKAAEFAGRRTRGDFIQGRALDFQANNVSRDVADFWIERFLDCRLAIGPEAGSRLLAKTVRAIWEQEIAPEQKEQLSTAVAAVRQSPRRRWSLQVFADQFLGDDLRDRFIAAISPRHIASSQFNFDREVFDRSVQYRIFHLESGVVVSSPFEQVGESVQIEDRHLTVEGEITDEKVRARP